MKFVSIAEQILSELRATNGQDSNLNLDDKQCAISAKSVISSPEPWDQRRADALIDAALARVGRLYDELAPGSPVDTPEWDRVEALVNAAYELKTMAGLRDALSNYEEHARQAFTAWRSQAA